MVELGWRPDDLAAARPDVVEAVRAGLFAKAATSLLEDPEELARELADVETTGLTPRQLLRVNEARLGLADLRTHQAELRRILFPADD